MTVREFFRQVRIAESELKVLNAKLDRFRDLGMSIGGSGSSGVIGNKRRGSSRVELAACGVVDALRDLDEQRRRYMAVIRRAEKVIAAVPQEKYRQLLSYRYLCGKSLRWISDELDYTDPNSIYRAHGWALKEAQKVLNRTVEDDGNSKM